ncbi:hypothetical protein RFI_00150 [Reticulomyxa filosa]|uniref:Heat shock protein 70 n=1 Tax=Reticulomyxa filosa TaxID=46433 RepID=X6PFQ6_RETFI|nr:hypothetical protein RFI_00150 [Reticulomyxa filosa]|eukprot:ETO36913.1 hypothetical protein RFI_00150 [Reticulomyxa filosa]
MVSIHDQKEELLIHIVYNQNIIQLLIDSLTSGVLTFKCVCRFWDWQIVCDFDMFANKETPGRLLDSEELKDDEEDNSNGSGENVKLDTSLDVPWCKSGKFNVIVAIDFGTDGTAMSVSLRNTQKVYTITDWNSNGICDQIDVNEKTRTALLLSNKNEVVAFGNEAVDKYAKAVKEGINNWLFFDKFKMHLCGNERKLKLKGCLRAANGKYVKSERVFVGALKYCKEKAQSYLKGKTLEQRDSDIQWVITVPVSWSDKSKARMMDWAHKAGLWNKAIPNQLVIVYEPECASMNLMLERQEAQRRECMLHEDVKEPPSHPSVSLQQGDRYLLLDLGAGTADMVCHEVVGPFQVKELLTSSGGPWGSSLIDARFQSILFEMFGEGVIKQFSKEKPEVFVTLMREFEKCKRRAFAGKIKKSKFSIAIPFELDDYLGCVCKNDLEELVQNYSFNQQQGYVSISYV